MKKTTPFAVLLFSLLFISTLAIAQQAYEYDWVTASPFTNDLNSNYSSSAFAVGDGGEQYSAMITSLYYNTGMGYLGSQELTRRNADGNIDWAITLNDSIFIRQIAATPNGGCILFGHFAGNLDLGGFYLPDNAYPIQTFLLAISETGTIDTLILASPTEGMKEAISFRIANAKIFTIVSGSGLISHIEIFDAVNFEHLETILQEQTFAVGDIDVDTSDNIYITGSCLSEFGQTTFNGTAVEAAGDYNKYLVKYNSEHQFEWIRAFGDITCTQPKVRVSPDGNSIYMSDNYMDSFVMGSTTLEGSNWINDFYIARFNPEGDILWAKEVPNFALVDVTLGKGDFIVAENNGVAITGSFKNDLTWNLDTILSGYDYRFNVFVMKLDENGNNNWVKGVQSQSGNTFGYSLGKAGDDYYMNGLIDNDCTFSDTYTFTGVYSQRFTAKLSGVPTGLSSLSGNVELSVYPNPGMDFLHINHGSELSGLAFAIYSVSGKRLYDGVFNNSIQTIDLRAFPPGVYVLRVDGGENKSVRFVKM